MQFQYSDYERMLDLLEANNYIFCDYNNYSQFNKCVILRHDVDFTLKKALDLARIENSRGVRSTYFILLSTDFYNVFSQNSMGMLNEILALGHDIGLHFDEKKYVVSNMEELEFYINKESIVLSDIISRQVQAVSMHRPSEWVLKEGTAFKSIINTYSHTFFKYFKYLSDSRMFWREDVMGIIENNSFDRLHILTHPFWYSSADQTMKCKIVDFIAASKIERYNFIKDNFKNLDEVVSINDI